MITELDRLIAEASVLAGGEHPCNILGHKWEHGGGMHCGCFPEADCSLPVHKCVSCGEYDYGDNDESKEIKTNCSKIEEYKILLKEEALEKALSGLSAI